MNVSRQLMLYFCMRKAVMTPSPIAVKAGDVPETEAKEVEVKGINRVSRHATFMSFALLGLGNVLTRGHLAGTVHILLYLLSYHAIRKLTYIMKISCIGECSLHFGL